MVATNAARSATRTQVRSRTATPRVLLLNERCHRHPLAGGAETHLFEICSRLVAGGASVELLCSGFAGAPTHDEHRGVKITRVGGRLSYYARVPGEARRRIARGQIDLIVEAHNKIPFLAPLYASVPVLVIHHHLHGLQAFQQVAPWIAAPALALEALIPMIYRRTPVLTISSSSKADLVRRGLREELVDVVPCGVDPTLFNDEPIEGRAPILLSLGRLEPYKRIDRLLRAMPAVLSAVPEAKLVIIGEGQHGAVLQRLAASIGVAHRVLFTGRVGEADKRAWLRQAALHVQCSAKEGWGLTVFEAYASGVPVVAADSQGLRDAVQDGLTGHLVRRVQPQTLAHAIVRLLRDEPRRVAMGSLARAWASQLSWDRAAGEVGHALGALLASRRHAEVPRTKRPAPCAVPGGPGDAPLPASPNLPYAVSRLAPAGHGVAR